jgi:hypothetical protein
MSLKKIQLLVTGSADIPHMRGRYVPEIPEQVESVQLCMYVHRVAPQKCIHFLLFILDVRVYTYFWATLSVQRSAVDVRTPTYWNQTTRNMTAPPLVLSPSSVLPPTSFNCAFIPSWRNLALLKLIYLYTFLLLFFFLHLCNSELRKSGSVLRDLNSVSPE